MQLPVTSKQFSIFFLLSAFLFSACTKIISTEIGGGLIPPVDGVNTKEMYLDVVSKNAVDTITRVGTSDDHALGYVVDPLFGTITASINVQLKPTVFPFSFPVPEDSIIAADSVVMVLSYKGVWGDSSQSLSFKVFEIAPDINDSITLSVDSAYTTDHLVEGGDELTENHIAKTVDPRTLNDSLYPFMEEATNQLRIRLDTSYARNKLFGFDSTVYGNDSLFGLIFKGYQIVPQAGYGNSLLRVNLLDTNTKLAIYFRYLDKTTPGKIDTAVRYFRCNLYTCGSSNYIQRNRTGTAAKAALPPFNNGSANDSLIYIDGNPGIYSRLEIPGLATLSNKIIHRAEILMEQVPNPTDISEHYLTAPNLFLTPYGQDSMRRFALPNDVQFGSGSIINQSSLGCFPFTKTDSAGELISAYSFDISRYVQGIITRHEKSYPLILYAPSVRDFVRLTETSVFTAFTGAISNGVYIPLNAPAFGRIRLGGGGNSIHRMRLRIVYSDL